MPSPCKRGWIASGALAVLNSAIMWEFIQPGQYPWAKFSMAAVSIAAGVKMVAEHRADVESLLRTRPIPRVTYNRLLHRNRFVQAQAFQCVLWGFFAFTAAVAPQGAEQQNDQQSSSIDKALAYALAKGFTCWSLISLSAVYHAYITEKERTTQVAVTLLQPLLPLHQVVPQPHGVSNAR